MPRKRKRSLCMVLLTALAIALYCALIWDATGHASVVHRTAMALAAQAETKAAWAKPHNILNTDNTYYKKNYHNNDNVIPNNKNNDYNNIIPNNKNNDYNTNDIIPNNKNNDYNNDNIIRNNDKGDKIPNSNSNNNNFKAASAPTLTEEMVGKRFDERLARLRMACKLYFNTTSLFRPKKAGYVPMPLYRPVMNVSVRYCPIAKTSATTWTGFFAAIRDHVEKKLHVKGTEDRSQADREIYFTFVREPYSRMLSGYVDKLLTPNTLFWSMTGRVVIKSFRPDASRMSLKCGHDVTFPEFVKYVVDSQRTGQHLNGHFIPTHDQCDPCTLPYRFIGLTETIKEDMPYIIKAIQSPINYTRTYDKDTIIQNAKMVLLRNRIPNVLKCMDKDEACRRLWRKYQIRGLISKTELFPFPKGGAVNISLWEFVDVALAAHESSQKNPRLKEQRVEALREAFASVPMEDRLLAQRTLFLDFEMFGFDPMLEDVFPKTPYVKDETFSYFNIFD